MQICPCACSVTKLRSLVSLFHFHRFAQWRKQRATQPSIFNENLDMISGCERSQFGLQVSGIPSGNHPPTVPGSSINPTDGSISCQTCQTQICFLTVSNFSPKQFPNDFKPTFSQFHVCMADPIRGGRTAVAAWTAEKSTRKPFLRVWCLVLAFFAGWLSCFVWLLQLENHGQ